MSDENKPVVVGRTWADIFAESQTGPKLDAALARLGVYLVDRTKVVGGRIATFFRRVDQKLQDLEIEPKAIPERVAKPILEAAAMEERTEIQELWVNLLVSAAKGEHVDDFYIGIVRQLDPDCVIAMRVAGQVSEGMLDDDPRFLEAIPDEGRQMLALERLDALYLASRYQIGTLPTALTRLGERLLQLVGEPVPEI